MLDLKFEKLMEICGELELISYEYQYLKHLSISFMHNYIWKSIFLNWNEYCSIKWFYR